MNTSLPRAVQLAKSAIDRIGAGIGLLLTAPLFPIISLATKLTSPGPVFYRQRRAGRLISQDGEAVPRFAEFEMLKFRTMVVDAEKNTGPVLASKNDPRVTSIGRFLRRTRLDELPQLWNVLCGDMSLVGPRPERPERQVDLAMAIPFFEERMRGVKPGITGLAQIKLGYTGRPSDDSEIKAFESMLTNPFSLPYGAGGSDDVAEADDMRLKLLYDLPYVASLEKFPEYLRMEASILAKTPIVMMLGVGR